jgi:hypothetical protein
MSDEAEDRKSAIERLQAIPGVGPSIAGDLWDLGISRVEDLKGRSPEELYQTHCDRVGYTVDRCLLYVFRCAVYFASDPRHDPEKLKWWNWKEKEGARGRAGERGRKEQGRK